MNQKKRWRPGLSLLVAAALVCGLFITPYGEPVLHASESTAAIQAEYYVDPVQGNDGQAGTELAPFRTLGKARDEVRAINGQMTGDIIVYLRGGTHSLSETLALTEQDSGTGGYQVVYRSYPGEAPVVSGGTSIEGWEIYDIGKNIYSAPAGADLNTRQLYVNGKRAVRARSADGLPDSVKVADGIATSMTELAGWGNITDLELVFKQNWTNPRGTVESVSVEGGTATLMMKQPGWYYLNNKGGTSVNLPWYYENAYELLDEEGEWYLDRSADTFFYKPRAGEDMGTADVTAPVLEQLITLQGSGLDQPIHDLRFEGISFQYTTWLAPGTEQAHPDVQSNILRIMDPNTGAVTEKLIPAAIDVVMGRSISFERCDFSRLGSAAVNITKGSQDNLIRGNTFVDISGSGVQVGEMKGSDPDYYNPIDPKRVLRNNDVVNNFFYGVGAEYRSAVAVFAAYPLDMDISHNEIANTPYSGITIGWGWGTTDTANRGTRIQNNYIHHVMQELIDGGAIYTLGTSWDMTISGNYIREQKHNFGSVYLDEGSSDITVRDNVMENVQIPVFVNLEAHDITVQRTYADNFKKVNAGKSTVAIDNILYTPDGSAWPAEATAIMDNAGIEEAYGDIIPDVPDLGTSEEPPAEPEPTPLPVSFQGKQALVTGIQKAGVIRNNWGGWVGTKITVGNNPLTVTALGRADLGGSLGVHRMRIVDAAAQSDLLNEPVRLVMTQAPANGDFKYVQLPAPVVLQANTSYYVLSEEKVGEDLWYDSDLKVQSTSAAAVNIGIWSNTFKTGVTAGNSFVGVDLLYEAEPASTPLPVSLPVPVVTEPEPEPEPLPLELEGTASAVLSMTPGTLRNDWNGWAGMKFTVGSAPVAVTALGRMFVEGNERVHKVRLVDAASESIVAETRVRLEGGTGGQFSYGQLYEPVRLLPGKSYYLLSLEKAGGDYWHNGDAVAAASSVIAIDKAISNSNDRVKRPDPYKDGYLAGNTYTGVDFRYSTEDVSVANLLNNGGFEYDTSSWSTYNASLSRVTAATYNGSMGSARVSVTASYGSARQTAALEKNKTYDVSVWVRLESGADVAQIILDHGSGTPRYTYLAANTPVDTTWRQLKASFKYTGTNADANASVQLRIGAGTAKLVYYFDDFMIKESAEQIYNGGFEQNTAGWSTYNAVLTRVTEATYGASAGSAKVVMNTAYGTAMQELVLKKNTSYEISVWVRLDSGADVAQIILDHRTGTPRYEYLAKNTPVDTEWRQLKAVYTYTGTNDNGNGAIQLRIGDGQTRKTYYFDNFSVIPVP
ncbi:MAG: hypothetical protein K0R57_6042 [Paenibacillaceae bacterium]|jgi:hypothetical protein|nr:hypothetical protein [Paenibacillaceae bacterium]